MTTRGRLLDAWKLETTRTALAWSDKTFLYAELTDEGRRIVAAEAGL